MKGWSVEPLGDGSLLFRAPPEAGSGAVAAAAARAARRAYPWLAELVPAYDSVAAHLKLRTLLGRQSGADSAGPPSYERAALLLLRELEADGDEREEAARTVEIPVVYGGAAGPDLADAAARSGMTERQFADAHAAADYEVAAIGFAPGFPYLSGLPEPLAQPRRETPRQRVPAGSVGIAGNQTGVYPVASPGGWQIIGRTPLRLFRPEAERPFPLRAGDRLRFVPLAAADADWRGQEAPADPGADEVRPGGALPEAALTVLRPGLADAVQDAGRGGWQAFGVSVGGAMDLEALRLANRLVGNAEDAAALELTLRGGEYRIERDCLIALAGADLAASVGGERLPTARPVLLRRGAVVRFGGAARGCRAYLALAGGIDVPPALGSRSTDARAGIGGVRGRALAAGDVLRCGEPSVAARRLADALRERARLGGAGWAAPRQAAAADFALPPPGTTPTLRALPGGDWHRFAVRTQRALAEGEYTVQPDSDRMGLRLAGAALPPAERTELRSRGVAPGAVQVPPGGQPIVLAAGCQPTGGYPVIAHVIAADRSLLAQLRPGYRIRFELVGLEAAHAAFREREREQAVRAAAARLAWFAANSPPLL